MSSKSKAAEGHHEIGHIVPMKVLFGTFGGLVLLTWITVAVTYVDLGSLNILIAMFIAVVKSSLVVLFFMHLKYDKPFHAVIFIAATLFVTLFISFALMDTREYASAIIPGYSPDMEIAAQEREQAEGTSAEAPAEAGHEGAAETPDGTAPDAAANESHDAAATETEAAPTDAGAGH
jgi:cytochrome c oxidase subunit 4